MRHVLCITSSDYPVQLCRCSSSVLARSMTKPTTQTIHRSHSQQWLLGAVSAMLVHMLMGWAFVGLYTCWSAERLWVWWCWRRGVCVVFQRPLMDHPYEEARSEWVSAPRNQRSKETPPRYTHTRTRFQSASHTHYFTQNPNAINYSLQVCHLFLCALTICLSPLESSSNYNLRPPGSH